MTNQFELEMINLGVKPLTGQKKLHDSGPPKPEPNNNNTNAADLQVLNESMAEDPNNSLVAIEDGDELCKPGLKMRDFAKLTQGKIHRQDSVNLRGYTAEESKQRLKSFLADSINSGFRCVKIVHGKGMNSPDGISVIRQQTQTILNQNKFILGYCRAKPNDGGAGAKYVLLKKRR